MVVAVARKRDKREQRRGRMKTILSNLRAVKSLSAGWGPKAHQVHREKPFGWSPKDLTVIREWRGEIESHMPPAALANLKGQAARPRLAIGLECSVQAYATHSGGMWRVHGGANPREKKPMAY